MSHKLTLTIDKDKILSQVIIRRNVGTITLTILTENDDLYRGTFSKDDFVILGVKTIVDVTTGLLNPTEDFMRDLELCELISGGDCLYFISGSAVSIMNCFNII